MRECMCVKCTWKSGKASVYNKRKGGKLCALSSLMFQFLPSDGAGDAVCVCVLVCFCVLVSVSRQAHNGLCTIVTKTFGNISFKI